MLKGLFDLPQGIRLSAPSVTDQVPDVLKNGIIAGYHGEDNGRGKAQAPHDGRGQGGPENGFSPKTKGHGCKGEYG